MIAVWPMSMWIPRAPGAQPSTAAFRPICELGPFGEEIVTAHTGQASKARRMSRAGDMSFNGVGIPALFMSLSQVPFSDADTDYVSLAFGKLIGGKMPWWWHTRDDTLDKVDPDVLRLDTQIYVSTLWRLCHAPLLPMDFRPVAADVQRTLDELAEAAGPHLDLSRAQHARSTWLPPLTRCPNAWLRLGRRTQTKRMRSTGSA